MAYRLIAVLAGCAVLPALFAQASKTGDADWPNYNRDLGGTRYSPLAQINTTNVASLKQAWSFRLQAGAGTALGGASQATPIVAGGRLYMPAGSRVVALDPDSGAEVWSYEVSNGRPSARGVSYWPGDRHNPPRIIFTSRRRLIALNANTGKLDPGFGKEGEVDMVVPYSGVPAVVGNTIVVGASVGEIPDGPPGDSRGYDAVAGRKLWDFHSVPQPNEIGHDTWDGDSWKGRSGVNVWGFTMTADAARGIVYMPFGGPAANYYGGDRKGNNLFANSVVAVDAVTGKLKWYFQTVHHDIWDSDLPPAPSLVDIVQNGKKIPALALIGKTGWMFILDRVTGKPVFGVEERPVPAGDVPGEWYAPTQPFPLKPPALARTSFQPADLVTAEDTTPEHVKACTELLRRSGAAGSFGPFPPFPFHQEGAAPKSAIIFPGGTGGANWGGTAVDPKSGYIFVNTHDEGLIGWMQKTPAGWIDPLTREGSPLPYDRGSVDGPGPYHSFGVAMKDAAGRPLGNWPCQKPPWGLLSAVNANTGEIAWQTRLGTTEGLPEGKRNTGSSSSPGPIVTAGGLVFIGATGDNRFRAFDSKTGKELWTTRLDYMANAVPMTYRGKSGKQYVAVIAAGGRPSEGASSNSQALVVFALPQ